jgi:hypothetical protein
VTFKTTLVPVDAEHLPFELDFGIHRWSTAKAPPEGYFPLTADLDGKRYELYSDGTFAEVEM